ncbi:MAG: cytochrome c3 family protein [Chloroflexota bacterium]
MPVLPDCINRFCSNCGYFLNRAGNGLRRLLLYLRYRKKLVALAIGFAGLAGVVPIMALGGHQLVEAVDSAAFCTETCHTVHYAEAVTYKESPHKEVACAQCHVGTGPENLVRSKIRGLSDIVPAITGNYEKPIPTPLQDRRPSSETCEKCHSSDMFFGDMPLIKTTYATDTANTKSTHTLVLKVDGGKQEVATGIHWHSTAKVWYLPLDDKQQKIGWVATENASGGITEYINPNLIDQITPELIQQKKQLMDCVDCHNRATHLFRSPDELIDAALSDGSIDITLPSIKQQAIEALVPQNDSLKQADAKIDQIKDFYETAYPQIVAEKADSTDSTLAKLKEIATLTTFADGLDWNTYPTNSAHNKPSDNMTVDFNAISLDGESPGCFRCHGTMVEVANPVGASLAEVLNGLSLTQARQQMVTTTIDFNKTGTKTGVLNADCNACHHTLDEPFASPLAPATPHPIDGLDDCLVCHSPTATQPFKITHPWSTNEACSSCHQSAPKLKTLPSSIPPADAKPIPHPTNKLENCLSCHGPSGTKPFTQDHPWSTNDTCATCHNSSPKPASIPSSAITPAMEINHATTGLSSCSACHNNLGLAPFPADHTGRPDSLCTICHQPGPVSAQSEPSLPQATAISHSISGLGNCISCHNETGPGPFPPDHAGRPNSFCTICHQASPASLPPTLPLSPPPGTTSPPADVAALYTTYCAACHGANLQGGSGPALTTTALSGRTLTRVTNDIANGVGSMPGYSSSLNSAQISALAAYLKGTTITVPSAPTGLSATAISATQVNLTWTDNANNESGFLIQRATDNTFSTNLVTLTVGANIRSYNDTSVIAGTTYYFRVFATGSAGNSAASNIASVTTPAAALAPLIAHTTSGYTDCLACHAATSFRPLPSSHAGRTNSTCTTCHQASGSTAAPMLTVGAPRLGHNLDSQRQNCLSCHDRGRTRPFPSDHTGRTNITCLVCHRTR